MVIKKNNPNYIKNPLTNQQTYIKINSKRYNLINELLEKYNGNLEKAKKEYINLTTVSSKKYQNIESKYFCGEECNYKPKSFPVNTEDRCRKALSYARVTNNPECIRKCALRIAKEKGWRCGMSKKK